MREREIEREGGQQECKMTNIKEVLKCDIGGAR